MKKIIYKMISLFWESVYRVRRLFYKLGVFPSVKFGVPLYSIGNLTFGGTGKTPLTIWLVKFFEELNLGPTVLTRGHKGKLEKSFGIIKGGESFKHGPVEYGDEPILIGRATQKGHVLVGRKRALLFEHFIESLRPDVAILDDGHQHLKIQRDLNFVLFDATCSLRTYQTPPMGQLREGLTALKEADVIVITRSDMVRPYKIEELKRFIRPHISSKTIFTQAAHQITGVHNVSSHPSYQLSELKGMKAVVVSALGSNSSFFTAVEELGVNIIERISFPDHHLYTPEDIEIILHKASKADLILTSEKDMVKIKRISTDGKLHYLAVEMIFLKGEAQLKEKIHQTLCDYGIRPSSTHSDHHLRME